MSRQLAGKSVLVTGGLGFIGSNLVLALLREGALVTVVDPCVAGCGGSPDNLGLSLARVRWCAHDIAHPETFEFAIRRADLIFNLAGEIRHHHSMIDPHRDLRLNVSGQLYFLEACARWNPGVRIVFAGTRQVYGVPQYLPVDEFHPVAPVDFNGAHKQAAISYHLLLSRQRKIDACVLQLTNVYGPRMALDVRGQGFLSAFLRCLRDSEPITVFGHGRQRRDPLFVDDAVHAFLMAATVPGLKQRIYNLGGPEVLTLHEIARQSVKAGGGNQPILCPFPPEQHAIDIGDYFANWSQIRLDLGWRPTVRFADGIRRSLNYSTAGNVKVSTIAGAATDRGET